MFFDDRCSGKARRQTSVLVFAPAYRQHAHKQVERTEDGRHWTAAATAIVRVALSNGSGHEDVGNAHLKDKDKGEVMERAKKARPVSSKRCRSSPAGAMENFEKPRTFQSRDESKTLSLSTRGHVSKRSSVAVNLAMVFSGHTVLYMLHTNMGKNDVPQENQAINGQYQNA